MFPTLLATPGLATFAAQMDDERQAHLTEFGEQQHPDGTGGSTRDLAADRLFQEAQAALQDGTVTWRHALEMMTAAVAAETDPAELRTLLVRTAAACAAWARDIDRRPHPMVCAHCGKPIETSESRSTWVGPLKAPGVPECASPRFHLGRPECRTASDRASDEWMREYRARTAVRTADPVVPAGQDDAS
ncbi:hypothetical protein ACF09L_32800 [Streptomyces sp. NPDC014779]|uniref:hypothetical protein n=1 Tax=Streptomyces sp. NPDC014779 TaxID=3364911 RepID=UPI0036F993BF